MKCPLCQSLAHTAIADERLQCASCGAKWRPGGRVRNRRRPTSLEREAARRGLVAARAALAATDPEREVAAK